MVEFLVNIGEVEEMETSGAEEDEKSSESLLIVTIHRGGVQEDNDD